MGAKPGRTPGPARQTVLGQIRRRQTVANARRFEEEAKSVADMAYLCQVPLNYLREVLGEEEPGIMSRLRVKGRERMRSSNARDTMGAKPMSHVHWPGNVTHWDGACPIASAKAARLIRFYDENAGTLAPASVQKRLRRVARRPKRAEAK